MITIVKFIANSEERSSNPILSKTLGKYGVFNDRDGSLSEEQVPSAGEFWRVEILKEVIIYKESGNAGGCFVLKPLSKIGHLDNGKPDITYLVPGGYNAVRFKTSLIVIPRTLGFNWVAGLDLRHHLRDTYHNDGKYELNSFVVSLDGSSEWPVEESGVGSVDNSTIYSGGI